MGEEIGVADAKRSFSELVGRVGNREAFRAGDDVRPVGLATFAGALDGEWDSVDDDMSAIVAERRHGRAGNGAVAPW